MRIIGFDISKYKIDGVIINKRATVIDSFCIDNSTDGIEDFLDSLKKKYIMGCESTSEYHYLLAKACLRRDIPFYLLNPIVTKRFVKATVRKKKTDMTDAHIVAKCILQGEGELIYEEAFNPVKPILRTYAQLSRLAVTCSHMKKRFSDHFSKEILIQKELDRLEKNIRLSMKKIQEQAIKKTDNHLIELLSSIPGIGSNMSSILIAEIGDINRFKNAKALIAYAGLDPKVMQSGNTLKRNTRLTKRGSPYLRRTAYIIAYIAQRYDPELKKYYEKKRAEGKRYKEATVANARHILTRVYAVWKRGTPYQVKKLDERL